jgi:hypothetical protein
MTPAEQAQMDAVGACTNKAEAVFPVLSQMPDTEGNGGTDVHVDAAGSFDFTATMSDKGRPLPDRFSCHGNLNQRTIEFVELNGVKKRPQPQEVWKF